MIVDGAPGLEAASWRSGASICRSSAATVHKHRNLWVHASKHLHDELTEDCRDMIYANAVPENETRRKAFLRKLQLKCGAVADSLEEADDRLARARRSMSAAADRRGDPSGAFAAWTGHALCPS